MNYRSPLQARKPAAALLSALATAAALAVVEPGYGQAMTAPQSTPEEALEEVVVSGRREPGAVIGDIEPEVQLSAQEIRALGVGNVSELLQALGPQLGSSRGRGGERPVVLVNGVRVSGFAEIRDLPTEAIMRTDILSEEVALKYGYRADQRVVNLVLRPRFRAWTGELNARGTADGGREGLDAGINWLRIQRDERLQFDFKLRHDDPLLESERRIVGDDGQSRSDAPFRSLLPDVDSWSTNATWVKPLSEGRSATVNATFDRSERASLLGLRPGVATESSLIRRDVQTDEARIGGLLQGVTAGWRWSANFAADRNTSESLTTGEGLSGRSRSDVVDLDLLANGDLADAPAGKLSATLRATLGTRSIESLSRRAGIERVVQLDRDRREAQLNLDIPLLDLPGMGRLTANLNGAVEDLSDIGSLDLFGYGLNWSRSRQWRLLASISEDEGAPSLQQRGSPSIVTPIVRTYDFLRGETRDISRIDGGNASLQPDRRRIEKLSFSTRPWDDIDFNLTVDYLRTETRDLIGSLPLATPSIESAFAERFTRDAQGRLLSIDARPLNLGSREREEWRATLSLNRPWGPQPEPPNWRGAGAGSGTGAGAGDEAARRARMAAMGERMMGFARRGSWQLSMTHTHRTRDEVRLGNAGIPLDLLNGDVLLDPTGIAKDELELNLGGARNGFGGRLTARWRSATEATSALDTLQFSALTTVGLRLFADLGLQPIAREYPSLRGARVAFIVDNLFDERQNVRNAQGITPINYQPDLLDPQGRTIRLTVRKVFFPAFAPSARPETRS
ncbi:MAG: TonB-dependent receptor plug domain-containing protein [Steroidobacteraceae bacterium]